MQVGNSEPDSAHNQSQKNLSGEQSTMHGQANQDQYQKQGKRGLWCRRAVQGKVKPDTRRKGHGSPQKPAFPISQELIGCCCNAAAEAGQFC